MNNNRSRIYNMPIYTGLIAPAGMLSQAAEDHALFTYYTMARHTWEDMIRDQVVYEGHAQPTTNFRQLFTQLAKLYGVQPEAMAKAWPAVDAQCRLLNLPLMPPEDKYRLAYQGETQQPDTNGEAGGISQ
jgi:hypothetical protein